MAERLTIPNLGKGASPGAIAEWYAADGDDVRAGDPLFRYEADFVAFDVEAEHDGMLHHRPAGDETPAAGRVVAYLLAADEEAPSEEEAWAGELDALAELDSDDAFAWEHAEPAAPAPEAALALPLKFRLLSERDEPEDAIGWAGEVPGDASEFEGPWPVPETVLRTEEHEPPPPAEAEDEDTANDFVWPGDEADEATPAVPAPWARDEARQEPVADADETWSWDDDDPPVKDPAESVDEFMERHEHGFEPHGEVAEPWSSELEVAPPPVEAYVEPRAATPAALSVSTTVRMGESRKMREQLAREWRGAAPGDEDVVLRAFARAVQEHDMLRGGTVDAGVVFLDGEGEHLAVLEGADSGPFRDAVAALAAARAAKEAPAGFAFTLTSFAGFGVERGTPRLPEGHAFAAAMGAVREVPEFDDDRVVRMPVVELALAYAPDLVGVAEAAALLARVRDLLESPYALVAA